MSTPEEYCLLDVTSCSLIEVHSHFRAICCLHIQSQRASEACHQEEANSKQGGHNAYILNVSELIWHYIEEDSHWCENLKSIITPNIKKTVTVILTWVFCVHVTAPFFKRQNV
jgi:hypothetical protein